MGAAFYAAQGCSMEDCVIDWEMDTADSGEQREMEAVMLRISYAEAVWELTYQKGRRSGDERVRFFDHQKDHAIIAEQKQAVDFVGMCHIHIVSSPAGCIIRRKPMSCFIWVTAFLS